MFDSDSDVDLFAESSSDGAEEIDYDINNPSIGLMGRLEKRAMDELE